MNVRTGLSACGWLTIAALYACGGGSDPAPQPEPTHYLTVLTVASSKGGGSVSGGGINCTITGTTFSGTCSLAIAEGAEVALTAMPTGEAAFDTWGGDCTGHAGCAVTMLADRTVTARFMNNFTVEIAVVPGSDGVGSITSNPAGIDCDINGQVLTGTCMAHFSDETAIILSAGATTGSHFTAWGGDAVTCGSTTQCVVPMTASRQATAGFALDP